MPKQKIMRDERESYGRRGEMDLEEAALGIKGHSWIGCCPESDVEPLCAAPFHREWRVD